MGSRDHARTGRIAGQLLGVTLACGLCAALGFGAGRALPVATSAGAPSVGALSERAVSRAPRIRTMYAPCPQAEPAVTIDPPPFEDAALECALGFDETIQARWDEADPAYRPEVVEEAADALAALCGPEGVDVATDCTEFPCVMVVSTAVDPGAAGAYQSAQELLAGCVEGTGFGFGASPSYGTADDRVARLHVVASEDELEAVLGERAFEARARVTQLWLEHFDP